MVLEDVQFHAPVVVEKKRGSLSLEGSSIDIAPPQKETISRRALIQQQQQQQYGNNQDSPRNSLDTSSSYFPGDSSVSSSQVVRINTGNVFSPSKREAISNIVQSQQDPSVKKITYDIVMPSMSFYQIENKEAFDQHYRSVSPTPLNSSNKSSQIRPPKYEAHLQSMDIRNDRNNLETLNNSLEIEKANIRSVNNSIVSSVANSQVLSSPIHHPQTRLPNIHQKKDIVFDKHNNTLSLAHDNHQRTINSAILNTTLEREHYHHMPQGKPNTTPTISCTALSGFIFSKVHGVQNISPHSYSKRYNPTTHTPTAKKPFFHGNTKKPYNGLVEISSFAKTRKKPHVDPDVIVR
ncbi:predicted protein [Naegleria gruberi]|uniref:Predicted protein n=1 Tax=Naegleria gruberi TaxID=5762 RepID=D2VUZ1_NAEGR|nr:uncharacterized protein NAEGRDRAFT_52464 [Naegleria gruberi]EFC39403.1 predicted protein [Naegleria gruberi]|eukprot:XP_002672147.1 predicted protein [Naegleria gruberi strain NEG-M]